MPIEVDLGSVIGPPGPTGETGPTGSPGAAATIQLGTVQSGQEADITNSGDNHNAIFNFVLPIGPPGQDGQNGTNGADGQDGAPGAAATIEVGEVTSGSTAQVSNSGTPNAAVLDFVLPVGPKGEAGADGADGEQGPPGTSATIQIGSVTSGDVAQVTNSGSDSAAVFNFVLPKGEKGDPWKFDKVYSSISAMNAGYTTDNVPEGGIVVINTGNVEDEDNAKVFVKGETEYEYLFDMSGSQGIQGEQGPPGQDGSPGQAATIQIGTVSSGTTAQVTNSGTANAAVLNFVLPRGPAGQDGADGVDGARGPAGTAATIQVGTVTSGDTASVTNVGTSSAARFNFVLPKGDKGDQGEQGEPGVAGRRGPQGVQGPAGADGKTPSFQIKSNGHLYAIWED